MAEENGNLVHYIWDNFRGIDKSLIGVLTLISAIPVILLFIDKINSLIPASPKIILILISISIVSLFIAAGLYKSCSSLYSENLRLNNNNLKQNPKIIEGRQPYSKNPKAKALLLLEPSNLFDYNIFVSIYYYAGKLEQLIAHGKVINIQNNNGIIQVEIENIFGGHENTIERIKHNEAECLKNVHVKPYIHTRFIDSFYSRDEVVVDGKY